MKRSLTALALAAFSLAAWSAPESYKIDDAHSFANWSIRHFAGRTSGTFTDIKGTLTLDLANPSSGAAEVTVGIFSLDSGHRERDIHVLTGDFLDGNRYPSMRFVSTGFRSTGKDVGVLTGQLTLHGATRSVDIPYKILGFAADPMGNRRAGFEGHFSLNRGDYGITKYLDSSGGGPLGNEIEITLLVEGLKLGPDGQVLNIKNQPAPAVAAPAPAASQAAQPEPAKKDSKPDLKDLLKGILK